MSRAFQVLRHAALALIFIAGSPFTVSAGDSAKLAMQGYDPVNYFTEGRPTKGSPEFAHVWDGERYFFASAKHRDMFAADPARYAPQFPGHCAAALTRGEIIVGNPEHWIIIDGKLYLFGKEVGPKAFRVDPGLVKKSEEGWSRIAKPTQ